jgi:prefoldin subunit 5
VRKEIEAIVKEQNQHYDIGKVITKDSETLKNAKKELTAQLVCALCSNLIPGSRYVLVSPNQRQRATEVQELHRSNAADKARLVRSPERIKQRIVDMSATSEALKPQIAQIESTTRAIQAKMDVLHTLHNVRLPCPCPCLVLVYGSATYLFIWQDTKDIMKDLQAIESDLEGLNETTKTVERHRAEVAERKESLKNYETETVVRN